jgi:hypothetical protein
MKHLQRGDLDAVQARSVFADARDSAGRMHANAAAFMVVGGSGIVGNVRASAR